MVRPKPANTAKPDTDADNTPKKAWPPDEADANKAAFDDVPKHPPL